MSEASGLVCSYLVDGSGGGTQLDWDGTRNWKPEDGFLWAHLDRGDAAVQAWLHGESDLDPLVCEALLAEDTRPRSAVFEDGMVVILRGINLNPGADPEDMVSIRMWIDSHRIISVRLRRLMAVEAIRTQLAESRGPRGPADFLVELCDQLVDRMGPVVDDFEDEAGDLEESVVSASTYDLRSRLGALRRRVIALRRYIAPLRDAMTRLWMEKVPWLDEIHRMRLREVSDRITRHVEDLDSVRDRAAVTQDELSSHLEQQMNRNMYVLSIVAAVFLPLGLITGLLGINVGGIPGSDTAWAFTAVCVGLVVLGVAEVVILRRLKWF